MGSPRAGVSFSIGSASDVLRLVVRSPFLVDVAEVTVAEIRASKPVIGKGIEAYSPVGNLADPAPFCVYTATPGHNEDLPVNCVDWATAHAYCTAHGGDLLTEAQYEALAGGLASTLYVWGDDDPQCGDAVFAEAGASFYVDLPGDCRPPGTSGGVSRAGAGARDALSLIGADNNQVSVVDLAGNLAEWAADQWNRQDEACWSAPGVYVDPRCDQPSPADSTKTIHPRRILGGAWYSAGPDLRAALRNWTADDATDPAYGFRCARPDG
jgi:formylglycine-generating enzyme required for sulfatase activity